MGDAAVREMEQADLVVLRREPSAWRGG